jgi:hypothetical protein
MKQEAGVAWSRKRKTTTGIEIQYVFYVEKRLDSSTPSLCLRSTCFCCAVQMHFPSVAAALSSSQRRGGIDRNVFDRAQLPQHF